MDQMTDSVLRTQRRRAAELAEREARVAAPDPVAAALAQHSQVMDEVRWRSEQVVPTGRGPVTPEPAPVRPAWDKFVWLLRGDLNYGMHLSALLRHAVKEAGYANVAAGLDAIEAER